MTTEMTYVTPGGSVRVPSRWVYVTRGGSVRYPSRILRVSDSGSARPMMEQIPYVEVTDPAPTYPVMDLVSWNGVTLNIDRASAGSEAGTFAQYKAYIADGLLPDNNMMIMREGQGSGLPATAGGSWTHTAWVDDMLDTGECPWYLPKGRKMIFGDIANNANGYPSEGNDATATFLTNIKYRVGLITELYGSNCIGILTPNEPERPNIRGNTQGSYYYLGGGAIGYAGSAAGQAAVQRNLIAVAKAVKEQLRQLPGGRGANRVQAVHNALVMGPAFAEPRKTGAWDYSVNLYDLYNAGYLDHVDCLNSHHHNGTGTFANHIGYNGEPVADANLSLWHICNAANLAKPGHGLPLVLDESGLSMSQPLSLTGWGALANPERDLLRKYRHGSMVCGILCRGPSIHINYAFHTGDNNFEFHYDYAAGTWVTRPSWFDLCDITNPAAYDINDLANGVIPITAKAWQQFGDPRTINVRCDTNRATVNTYASGLAPFNEWLQTTFADNLITMTTGTRKIVERPVWLRSVAPHRVTMEVRASGHANAKAKIAIQGHNKVDGTVRVTSATEATNGAGWVTLTADFTPVQHGDTRIFDPVYCVVQLDNYGLGTVETRNWNIKLI